MTQEQRLDFLIRWLLKERKASENTALSPELAEKRRILRSLMNVRPPAAISEEFLKVQDAYLEERLAERGTVSLKELTPVRPGIYLWQGDITRLAVDAVVNAANSQMLGCFVPCHGCIDNAIHTYAGIQLRLACARIMAAQKEAEPAGKAKITKAYNLPARYVLHTVGPLIKESVTQADRELLADCYRSCLELAAANGLHSVAFCCISTGEFRFPNEPAAEIAVRTVQAWQKQNPDNIEVIFNVFKDHDLEIYRRLLR